jgi:hypothetical protein
MKFEKAKDTEGAVLACKPFPLVEPGDLRYVDLSEPYGLCRGNKNRLVEELKPTDWNPSHHIVLAGPGGSGKTTLVLQSFNQFRKNGLYPVHIDVIETLDPGNIQYSDLLLTMVAGVGRVIEEDKELTVGIDKSSIGDVVDWFKKRVLSEEHVKELELGVETGAEAKGGIPLIGSLFAKVTASFRGGSKYREEIRQSIDKRPNELLEKVNVFLDAVTKSMRDANTGYKEIIVFFDNLEKITNASNQVDQALINKAPLHRQVRCKTLYTIPFSLLLNPGESGVVPNAFTLEVIPMVALREKEASPDTLDENRKKAFSEIIRKRVNVESVFESEIYLDDVLRYSGGCPRDLLSITRLACEYAGDGKVNGDHVKKAVNRARVEHLRPVKGSDFAILSKVHQDKYIENTEDEFRLLYHRLLVHYNDTEWYDAHPLVQEDPRFKRALSKLGGVPE